MVEVKFRLMKRDFVWIGLIVVLVGVGIVYAIGSGNGSVMGHSGDEIVLNDAFCAEITGHGCGSDNSVVVDDAFCEQVTGHACGFDLNSTAAPVITPTVPSTPLPPCLTCSATCMMGGIWDSSRGCYTSCVRDTNCGFT